MIWNFNQSINQCGNPPPELWNADPGGNPPPEPWNADPGGNPPPEPWKE
ncbi:MAG: hypothetical protein ACFE7R_00855 [Candidatus Hodarchaeota archaeon]